MAIVRVNTTWNVSGGSGASIAATAISHTGGNFVAAYVHWEGSGTLTSVTDTAGNTYTKKTEARQTAADASQFAYAFNITGNASNVVTANFSGTIDFSNLIVIQYSGIQTTDPFDTQATGNGSSTTAASGSATPTAVDMLLLNGAVNFGGGVTWSPTSPWVTEVKENNNGAVDERIVTPASGSYTAAQTASVSTDWAINFIAFKAAAAASGDTQEWRFYPPQRRMSAPNISY